MGPLGPMPWKVMDHGTMTQAHYKSEGQIELNLVFCISVFVLPAKHGRHLGIMSLSMQLVLSTCHPSLLHF